MADIVVYSRKRENLKRLVKRSAQMMSASLLVGLSLHLLLVTLQIVPKSAVLQQPLFTKAQASTITPVTLTISSPNINAPIHAVGLDEHDRMELPRDEHSIGWYQHTGSLSFTENYHIILTGHVDSKNGPGVFYKLDQINTGDSISLTDQQGDATYFIVEKVELYDLSNFPISYIFAPTTSPRLILITCDGTFNKEAQIYSHRLVVMAKPV